VIFESSGHLLPYKQGEFGIRQVAAAYGDGFSMLIGIFKVQRPGFAPPYRSIG